MGGALQFCSHGQFESGCVPIGQIITAGSWSCDARRLEREKYIVITHGDNDNLSNDMKQLHTKLWLT